MSFCSLNICHLASRNALKHFCGGTGWENVTTVNNSRPVTLHIQFTPLGVLFLKQHCLYIAKANRKLDIILQATGYICFPSPSDFHLSCSNDASLQVVKEPTSFVWAPRFFMCTGFFSFFTFVTVWVICLNHTKPLNKHLSSLARKIKCAPSSKTLMSMQCSDIFPGFLACQEKTHIVYSPITNSKWQRIFRHSGQICKISGNEFQPAWARVICNYNGSDLPMQVRTI